MLIDAKMFQIESARLSAVHIVNREVGTILHVTLISHLMLIRLLISEIHTKRCQQKADFLLLATAHMHFVSVHVGKQRTILSACALAQLQPTDIL